MISLTIVVVAYNRPAALKTLLCSLSNLKFEGVLRLIISIDNNGTTEVNEIAQRFKWNFGPKEVIIHREQKGLKNHFIWAGDLTDKYGDILFLEDDLYVSQYAIQFCIEAAKKYSDDDRVAGISLYCPSLCEFDKCKFIPVDDGYDNFFFQHPYWGNVWQKHKWRDFKRWLSTYSYEPLLLPPAVRMWGDKSFKKIYIQYLIETSKYIVYPRISCVTNMGETGVHCDFSINQFQVPLVCGKKKYSLSSFEESNSIYDAFFEIESKLISRLLNDKKISTLCIDLRGMRDIYNSEYVLTTKESNNPLLCYSDKQHPLESNVFNGVFGNGITLTKVNDIRKNKKDQKYHIAHDVLDENYCLTFSDSRTVFLYSLKKRIRESRIGKIFARKKEEKRKNKK